MLDLCRRWPTLSSIQRASVAAAYSVVLLTGSAAPLAAAQGATDLTYTVTPLVDGLTVQQLGYYIGPHNVMNFYGEVSNQTDRPLAGVGLLIEIFNDRDERLARGATQDLSSNIIQPGGKAVWQTYVSDTPTAWARIQISVGVTSLSSTIASQDYPDLTLSDIKTTPNFDNTDLKIEGTVTNTGTQVARSINFGAGVYDQSGKLVAVALGGTLNPLPDDQTLAPGASNGFLVLALRSSGLPTEPRIETYVQSRNRQ